MKLINGKITMMNKEEITFELYPEETPITVENFVKLDDGTTEVIFQCIECDYEFIPLGEL